VIAQPHVLQQGALLLDEGRVVDKPPNGDRVSRNSRCFPKIHLHIRGEVTSTSCAVLLVELSFERKAP